MSEPVRAPLPTCDEVTLGAFLHDIGKFSQRAFAKPAVLSPEVRARESDVLPSFQGRSSHWHALWTDFFFNEVVERNPLPRAVDRRWVRDCAVYHHKPLQDGVGVPHGSVTWLIAEADRIASGMERKQRDEGEDADPAGMGGERYRKTLLSSVFANIGIHDGIIR